MLRYDSDHNKYCELYNGEAGQIGKKNGNLKVLFMYADADPLDEPGICFEVE